jgi:hypothetical protein
MFGNPKLFANVMLASVADNVKMVKTKKLILPADFLLKH